MAGRSRDKKRKHVQVFGINDPCCFYGESATSFIGYVNDLKKLSGDVGFDTLFLNVDKHETNINIAYDLFNEFIGNIEKHD